MSRKYRVVPLVLSVFAASAGAGVAQASIPPQGFPDFGTLSYNAAVLGSASSGYTLTITGRDPSYGAFNFPGTAYRITGEVVELTAHFDSSGHLLKNEPNTIEIFGSLAGSANPTRGTAPTNASWSKQPFELLFEAVLTSVTVNSKHQELGFSTHDFSGWADQLQFTNSTNPSESLWLYSLPIQHSIASSNLLSGQSGNSWDQFLWEVQNHRSLHDAYFHELGSVATVPLPGTGLLMLGGLAGLGAMVRRRRADAVG